MTVKKSKPYSINGESVSFSNVNNKFIGMSIKNSNGLFQPEDNKSSNFNVFKASEESLDAFRKSVYGPNKSSYPESIVSASDEEMSQFFASENKKFNNAQFVTNDFDKPKAIAYTKSKDNQNRFTGTTGGGESGYNPQTRATQLYAYPFDIDLEQDHLKITRHEYLRSSINASKPPSIEYVDDQNNASQSDNATAKKVRGGSVLGILKGSVILPMPKVTDVNAADWGKSELNAQGIAAAGLAAKFIGQPGETPEERERRLAAFEQLKEQRGGEEGGSVRRKTTGAIYNQIVAKTAGMLLGTDLNADTVLARQGGTVLNPNAEMLFQGPALRDFTFKYRMIARSQKEGEMIRNIIRFLKLGMAPKFRSSTYLKSPDVFSLEYKRGKGEDGILDTVNRFSPGGLALTSINTDYAPNSYWSAYQDSQPVEITMDLNFVELRPIYYNDQALTPTSSVGY